MRALSLPPQLCPVREPSTCQSAVLLPGARHLHLAYGGGQDPTALFGATERTVGNTIVPVSSGGNARILGQRVGSDTEVFCPLRLRRPSLMRSLCGLTWLTCVSRTTALAFPRANRSPEPPFLSTLPAAWGFMSQGPCLSPALVSATCSPCSPEGCGPAGGSEN